MLVNFYSAADVFVYPSLVEGFGLPPVEAEYCGVPVVASDIPIFRETLSGIVRLVPPLDHEALAGAILAVINNPHSQPRCPRMKRQYRWDQMAGQYLSLL